MLRVVFLCVKTAFDTVDHTLLLSKRERYGITGPEGDWFSLYLSSRTQSCVLNSCKSSETFVTSGVAQGGHFRPVIIFIVHK